MARDIARAQCYKALAECYHEPCAALEQTVRGLKQDAPVSCSELLQLMQEVGLQALRVDHAKLFVGPFALQAAPYGSVYLERQGRLMGDSTLRVRAAYRHEGLELAQLDAPDHIAIELEFMHYLVAKGVARLPSGTAPSRHGWLIKQRRFLDENLASWVEPFAARVIENASTTFYRRLAHQTEAFVREETVLLSDLTAEG